MSIIWRGRGVQFLARLFVLGVGATMATSLAPHRAEAWTEQVIYSFCSRGANCTAGDGPLDGLLMDKSGNLYGTTSINGAQGGGTAFELTPNSAKTVWTGKVLYSFCASSDCHDGSYPKAGLIMDASGNLYGTDQGGSPGQGQVGGVVFELTPNSAKTAWTEKALYNFCSSNHFSSSHCTDGGEPQAGLLMDTSGRLYGTTIYGGAHSSGQLGGVVFALTPNSTKTAWTYEVLYSFCSNPDCTDGDNPVSGLIMDKSGNLYGTTSAGGRYNFGTVYELTPNSAPNSAKTAWTYKVLYSFCAQRRCEDGALPVAGLLMDTSGNLYGTTSYGGAHRGGGTVFELTPDSAKTAWTEKVLYSFCTQVRCEDGWSPQGDLITDKSGNLYGTTRYGGAHHNWGTVFELTPDSAKTAWTEKVLYSFCAQANCTDGDIPVAGLIMDTSGNLYGMANGGGASDRGAVFVLKP